MEKEVSGEHNTSYYSITGSRGENKRRRADEPQNHEQALSTMGDSERLTGSFVNDVLQHFVVNRPEVYLVDSMRWPSGTWPATGISLFRIVQPRVPRLLSPNLFVDSKLKRHANS